MGASPPADKYAEIADRLVTQTEEQVIRLGRRSGHWTEADVDWVVGGSAGPRPDQTNADAPRPQPESPAAAGDERAVSDVGVPAQVDEQGPVDVEVVQASPAFQAAQRAAAPATVDDRDLLARGLAHPDPKIRAVAERAAIAVDQLVTALARRTS